MIHIKTASKDDIELFMNIRLEMLKVVNNLSEDHVFSDELINESRDYFINGDHITVFPSVHL